MVPSAEAAKVLVGPPNPTGESESLMVRFRPRSNTIAIASLDLPLNLRFKGKCDVLTVMELYYGSLRENLQRSMTYVDQSRNG